MTCELCVTELKSEPVKVLSIGEIIKRAAEYFNMPPADIVGERQFRELVFARMMIMKYFRTINGKLYSYARIGEIFGGRDHTTTIHNLRTYDDLKSAYGEEVTNIYNEMTKFIKDYGGKELNTMDWSYVEHRPWVHKSRRGLCFLLHVPGRRAV